MQIKFEIYQDGQRAVNFVPTAVTAIGPESVPGTGEITFKDGVLSIERDDPHAVGVALLWDAGPLGAFHMETPRLIPREKPYNLNVELARFRLMKIVQKQEDWSLFDFPRAEPLFVKFREAQSVFSDALSCLDDGPAASKLADQSIRLSLALSDELSMFHSDLLLQRRAGAKAFVKHIFGCRVNTQVQNQKYHDTPPGRFDYAVLPASWKMLSPQEGSFTPEDVDVWVDQLVAARMPIIAGPLVDFTEEELPDWLFIWENDFDTLREMAYEHVQRVVSRYRKKVALWNVVSSISTNSVFSLTFEQMIELTRLLVAQVKNILPTARTLVTISQPFGEYHAHNPGSVAPMLYAEMIAQAGINFDGYALQIEMGIPRTGMFVRDLFQISAMLDKFSTIGRPVFLTGVLCPGKSSADQNDQSGSRMTPAQAGQWRKPWDPHLQADWMEAVYRIALSKPFVESVAWSDLADIHPSMPAGGLLNDMFQPKPVFDRLQQLRTKFSQWSRK